MANSPGRYGRWCHSKGVQAIPQDNDIQCRCENGQLWKLCDDDLFCPLCGERVSRLRSENQYPPKDEQAPIWIYPKIQTDWDTKQYAFPLSVEYADQERACKERTPVIDFPASEVQQTRWFTNNLEALPDDRGRNFQCRLIRRDEAIPDSEKTKELVLPNQGLDVHVRLSGDFGSKQFDLKVCNTAQVDIDLEELDANNGHGIEKDNTGCWEVMLCGELDLNLIIRAVTAPVYVVEDLTKIEVVPSEDWPNQGAGPLVSVHLIEPLRAGTIIVPDQPWRSPMRMNTQRFQPAGQKCLLMVPLKIAIVRTPPRIIKLERVDKGRVEFFPRNPDVNVMYLGEVRSNALHENCEGPDYPTVIGKLEVSNIGEDTVQLNRPTLKSPRDWIQVDWAKDTDANSDCQFPDPNGDIELKPNQHSEIYIKVDLTGFSQNDLPEDGSLQATIVTNDQRNTLWEVDFRILEVRPRQPLEHPIAVDIGNSHSYVAVLNPGLPYPDQGVIVPVHDLENPEQFPTSLFFHCLEEEKYTIGHDAIRCKVLQPRALETDLKRRFAIPGDSATRGVCDKGNDSRNMSIESLVRLYLKGLIHRVEAILRGYTVTKFSVTYPARFGGGRRKEFQRIIKEFANNGADTPGREPLEVVELEIDEANAVAIGFAFEEEVQKLDVANFLQDQAPSFVVASFDWGGGSLDTALLRFTVTNNDFTAPIYKSEYLGIGGSDRFGGDNVTLAFVERLKARICAKLGHDDTWVRRVLDQIPLPFELERAGREFFLRYQALWEAAEQIKLYQSDSQYGALGPSDLDVLKDKLVLQLINGLLLTGPEASNPSEELVRVREGLQREIDNGTFLVPLEDVYTHPIQHDMWETFVSPYTIKQRVTEYVKELRGFADAKEVEIDFVVLGGSACRLPLVQSIFKKHLPNAILNFAPDRAKYRVAFGLVRYLEAMTQSHVFARSRDHTCRCIGRWPPGGTTFEEFVPACTHVGTDADDSTVWHKLHWKDHPRTLTQLLENPNLIRLYVYDPYQSRKPFGWFDLSETPTSCQECDNDCFSVENVVQIADTAHAEIRFRGSETDVELRIECNGEYWGYWRMHPGAPP